MDCDYSGLIDMVSEIMKITRLFIPIWIMIGIGIGVGVAHFFNDIRRQ